VVVVELVRLVHTSAVVVELVVIGHKLQHLQFQQIILSP
jgi:hypothetical protein